MKKIFSHNDYLNLSNCLRIIAADAIELAASGHPGMPLGMADIMTILAFKHLRFCPFNPKWLGRDRLIFSAGHGSMLLYAFYYLSDYQDFTLEDIKNFRRLHSKTAGHPEFNSYPAIEATTGPLGQGLANAVGMAIAAKKYRDKIGDLADYKIYVIVGDGCLMEGISYEASSLAGHLGLDNLIILFDDNNISIDGSTSLAVSENHINKFESLGFETMQIDGHNFLEIDQALTKAKEIKDKPVFIACKTTIAKGCASKEGKNTAHGSPLGEKALQELKDFCSFKKESFFLPEEYKKIWSLSWEFNQDYYQEWQKNFSLLTEDKKQYLLPFNIKDLSILNDGHSSDEATRVSFGKLLSKINLSSNKIILGSADLSSSTSINSSSNCKIISKNNFSGCFIHYGVREHAMAAIMNGLALSGFLPIGSSFLVFSDYLRPALRLSAIMRQQVIYVMTHDSIGVGEDGPTHQPVEHLASLRAMPNLLVLRPADYVETAECLEIALNNKNGPSLLVLSRQTLPQLNRDNIPNNLEARNFSNFGAYVIKENLGENKVNDIVINILATGSEVSLAMEVSRILEKNLLTNRVISAPCLELFSQQKDEYKNFIFGEGENITYLNIVIEAASSMGWEFFTMREGLFFGVNDFGHSATYKDVYKFFGLTAENISKKIIEKYHLLIKQKIEKSNLIR